MQKLNIFYYFTCILSEMCMLEQYRGNEEKTTEVVVIGENYTSICPDRLKIFANCTVLRVENTNLEHIPTGVEHLLNLKEFHYCRNKSIGTDEDFARLKGLKKLEIINLNKNNMKTIPASLGQSQTSKTGLVTFIAYNTNIARIFSYVPYKKQITKIFNYFTVSANFPALKELNINNNQITVIPAWIFELRQLEILNLADNQISDITGKIGLLANLTELNVKGNKIETIPNEICNLIRLTKCLFSCNHIKSIPKSFFSLPKLTEAFLSSNNLDALSISNGDLINLVNLNISNNTINYLMIEKNSLPNLNYLDVSYNKLKELSPNFYFPKNLNLLFITKNLLTALPQIKNLTKLKYLNLSYNRLSALPSEMRSFEELDWLNASFNCLKELPDDFGTLKKLSCLLLEKNNLSALPSSASSLECIRILNLSNNRFKIIPSEMYYMNELQQLDFDGNLLENLGNDHVIPLSNGSYDKNKVNVQVEAPVCTKSFFSLKNIKHMSFNNNKMTNISSDIKLLTNLTTLSLKNNEIKTIPEEIGELKEIKSINLESNILQYLPFSIKKLRRQNLAMLTISENVISFKDTEYGLGLGSIMSLKFPGLAHSPQYNIVTIDDVVSNMKKDALHWNLDELKTIKMPSDLSEFSTKISDKQMRKIWRVVLKYFLVTEEMIKEHDSESSDEENTDIDNKITKITDLNVFKDIKTKKQNGLPHVVIDDMDKTYMPLYKKISKLLRDNSTPKTENPIVIHKMQEFLKNSIKAIFYKFLEKIIEDNNDLESLELIKLAITELCEHKLLTCIDGQLEGLQYYYSMFYSSGNEVTNNSIIDFIRDTIASNKEIAFVNVTNGEGENGVHNISKWRAVFKDLLGIQHSFDDPYANMFSSGNTKYRTGNVLHDFFKKFTVENIAADLLKKINSNMDKLNESVTLLKDILTVEQPDVDDYTLYMDAIEKFYKYNTISGYSELQPTKLKKNGLIKILLHLKIVTENLTISLNK